MAKYLVIVESTAKVNTINKFLEILGVKDSIHEETEKIEHTINYDTLEKMETLINFFSKYQGIYSLLKEFQEDKHLDT